MINITLLKLLGLIQSSEARAEDYDFFEQKVRPLLVDRCYKCHSTESEKVKGGLYLDTKEGWLRGGENGPAIVPGDPEKSLLTKAVRYLDPNLQMPPKARLTEGQIADLVSWIKMGAPDPRVGKAGGKAGDAPKVAYDFAEARKHWSFQPPKAPPLPRVKSSEWIQSPVDQFILAKLEEKNLLPASPADKRTLIRRATFDLIGLPPRPEEIAAFLADSSPHAFKTVIEALLISPHYGERWGRHWLDVVRYADGRDLRYVGAGHDIGEAWRYRDWVVNSFNHDLPYNEFIMHQIAGDLLPRGDKGVIPPEAVIPTGLLAIGEWGIGDSDAAKMHSDIVDDQVNVISRAFLSLTVSCARCHDHKFEPIPTADYYSLAGIFFSSHICTPSTSCLIVRRPIISESEVEKFNQYMARIAEKEKQIQQYTNEQYASLTKSSVPQTARYLMAAWDYQTRPIEQALVGVGSFANERQMREDALSQWIDYLNFRGSEGHLLTNAIRDSNSPSGVYAWNGKSPDGALLVNTTDQPVVVSRGTNLPAQLAAKLPPRSVALNPASSGGVSVRWKSPLTGLIRIAGRVKDAQPGAGDGVEWLVEARHADINLALVGGVIEDGGMDSFEKAKGAERLGPLLVQTGDSIRVVVLPRKDSAGDMTTLEVEIAEITGKKRHWSLGRDLVPGNLASDIVADLAAKGKGNPHPDGYGNSDTWSYYDLSEPAPAMKRAERGPQSPLAGWFEALGNGPVALGNRSELERAAAEVQQALQAVAVRMEAPATNPPPAVAAMPPTAAARLYLDLISDQGPFRYAKRDNEKLLPKETLATLKKLGLEYEALKKNAPSPVPVALAIKEGGSPGTKYAGIHDVPIHRRGRYDQLGEVVPRRFPRVLAGETQPLIGTNVSGRLELARWIAQPENPLPARVMVNRIWQHHFGEGLVRTPGNFGRQGERPTHPELLDFLAVRFVESGWSIKAMHRLIMLSSAYQQSSGALPETASADPDNRLVGRMSIRRLEAEAIRDSLLAVTLKLDRTLGGPPTRDVLSPRRAIYLMTIRSDKSGFPFVFDTADPENVVDKRVVSTVAPQSLFLLNNPFPISLVPAFVERILGNGLGSEVHCIEQAYLALYGRPITEKERSLGLEFLARSRQKNAESSNPSRLAWEEYSQVLLCGNEFIYVN